MKKIIQIGTKAGKDGFIWHAFQKEEFESLLMETNSEINHQTIESLIAKYQWEKEEIECLFIDADGKDKEILLSIDFSKLNINKIIFENDHIYGPTKSAASFMKVKNYLAGHGYKFFINLANSNTLAAKK